MSKHDATVGIAVIIGAFVCTCVCTVGGWLLNVYFIVKTAKWMDWL